jgi:thiol peroxidase
MATVTLHGDTINTSGELPAVGSDAPDFHLVDGKLNDVRLADYSGKKILLNIVPSLDTPTCATSTKKFNEKAAGRDDFVVLVVSADLPFAQGRFCSAEGILWCWWCLLIYRSHRDVSAVPRVSRMLRPCP